MKKISKLTIACLLLALAGLASACVAPPPSPEQVEAWQRYADARATDAAAAELIASAKATEAAAALQISQLTAEAAPTTPVTTTATLTPTILITGTEPATSTVVLSPTVTVTDIVTGALATLAVTATAEITATPTLSATATVIPTSTTTATPQPEATATPTPTATTALTPTTVSSTVAAEGGWVWPGLPGAASTGQGPASTPTPAPTPQTFGFVTVTTQEANLRAGPGITFPVVANAARNDTLQVIGSNNGQTWWQVCCIDDATGWVSQSVVRFAGDAQAVPVAGPLLPDDLNAVWALRWECHGNGCNQEECFGQSQANALRVADDRWLEVTRTATWPDGCGEDEDWLTQVDRYTGQERQGSGSAPLFSIWQGANPGPANRTIDMLDTQLSVWCTDTRTQEVEQQDGWSVLYEGQACYDTRSGVVALMQYVKRWLFTGTVDGQTFDRQYFGDYEVYQQVLTGTNAPLSGQPAGPGQ